MKFINTSLVRVKSAFEKFFAYESSSGILLMIVTVLAFIVSNSNFSDLYFSIWNYQFVIGWEGFSLSKPTILWINDGLMAIFFFLVGLEIKREILIGELSDIKQALLPIGAALGGIFFPALFFFLLEKEHTQGWAIPMATDIAFSLGILKLLGNRIPYSLKVFLTAFAIIDDIAAVLVIAIFYSSNIQLFLLGISSIIILFLIFFNINHITNSLFYIIPGIILWLLFLKSGIHPTIAAIIVAFTIPAKPKAEIENFIYHLEEAKNLFLDKKSREKEILLTKEQYHVLENLESNIEYLQSPIQKWEHKIYGLVSFFIMPLFAFANAGVNVKPETLGSLSFHISISLVSGKLIGIVLGTYLIIKIFKSSLPEGCNFQHIVGIGFLGGVGFTMSLFINNLSYTDSLILDQARLGILLGSLFSGLAGYLVLRFNRQ